VLFRCVAAVCSEYVRFSYPIRNVSVLTVACTDAQGRLHGRRPTGLRAPLIYGFMSEAVEVPAE
jgi:hypothetical protein